MFLRQLTLKGFKSFAETTALDLEPGVTVVVGPNGSGKSNVVDAIAWVLGAQAPSSVRSQKMDDVIFAGTARRPALGRAEVSLTIDNSAGLLAIEFSEVTITRTLWRSGDSEYAINGVPCRLLDVQELLSDSGVGRQQHVIVSQGQIDGVLNARPEDRRAIIEEAAGVLKYRKRKERAERRLEATEGNLLRVQDLLREVRRQLRPLERQAEAARRHGEVVGELTTLRIHVTGREIAALQRRGETLAEERRQLDEQEGAVRRELARMDTAVLAAEASLGAGGTGDVGDALVRVEQLRERARGLSAVLLERRRSLERDRVQLMDESVAVSLEADAARLRSELAAVAEARRALEPEVRALEDDEWTAGGAEPATDGDAADEDAADGTRAARAAAEVRGELHARRAARLQGSEALTHSGTRISTLEEKQRLLVARITELDQEVAQLVEAEGRLATEVEAAGAALEHGDAEVVAAEAAHREAEARATAWTARVEAFAQALDAARAKAGAEHLGNVDGVLGSLLDVVEIEHGWEAAVEAALGEALGSVVVADTGAARRALGHLHAARVHGGVLAPGPAPSGRRTAPAVDLTGGRSVRALVRAGDARVATVLDDLLTGAVVLDGGWSDALDLALAHPDLTVVTREGDRFSPAGFRVGLGGAGATAAALDEARTRSATVAVDVTTAGQRLADLRRERDALAAGHGSLRARLDSLVADRAGAEQAVDGARRRGDDLRTALDQFRSEREALVAAGTREETVVAELERSLEALEADEASEVEAARLRYEQRRRREERAQALATRRRDLAVRTAGVDERAALLEQRLHDVESRLEAGSRAHADAGARVELIERSSLAVGRLADLVERHRRTVELRLTELHEQRRRQLEAARAASQALEQLRVERADAERKLAEIGERQRRCEITDAEVRTRLEAAVEHVRHELDTEPSVAMATEQPPLPEGVTAAARVRDLEREIRLMGPINPLALEEFTALQERHGFLEQQLEDVRSTRRDLQRVIRSVDAEIQSVFAAAFADVSENFTALFTTLFPGGIGRLILTQPEDLLATGIEVEAKPSGKNVKKLSLLSGGERSLTALAFLFAVFRSRPSPFYVMDEVEAALDDVNLHRFLGLLAEFRADAQLLVVSHQKRTMEAADSLIGVTMQPGGSSKVLVERISTQV